MRLLPFILFLLLVLPSISYGLDTVNEKFIKYVKTAKDFEDIKQLHDYLIKPAKSKRERAELFFYWIAQHIEYDIEQKDLILDGEDQKKYDVLKEKKGVCKDYSRLFKSLCDLSDIECHYISGYAKSGDYEPGMQVEIKHAWNIVKLDDQYEFVDCTWGSGEVFTKPDGQEQYKKAMDLSQVFVRSNAFRQSHLPGSPKWQLLEQPVSYTAFVENTEFEAMQSESNTTINYKDSISQFISLPEHFQPVKERIDIYRFNSTYKHAFKIGHYYEAQGSKLAHGDYNQDHLNTAISYYQASKKWYVTSFKMVNKNQNKPDRQQIEFIKKVNKRIKYCEFRLMSRT